MSSIAGPAYFMAVTAKPLKEPHREKAAPPTLRCPLSRLLAVDQVAACQGLDFVHELSETTPSGKPYQGSFVAGGLSRASRGQVSTRGEHLPPSAPFVVGVYPSHLSAFACLHRTWLPPQALGTGPRLAAAFPQEGRSRPASHYLRHAPTHETNVRLTCQRGEEPPSLISSASPISSRSLFS